MKMAVSYVCKHMTFPNICSHMFGKRPNLKHMKMAVSYVCKHMNFANIRFICFENEKNQTYENWHFICLQTCEIINVPMYDSYVWYKNSCFICLQTWKQTNL